MNKHKVNQRELGLTILVPCFNEEDAIGEFYHRLTTVLASVKMKTEIIFINDGSQDRTLNILESMQKKDSRIGIINFSRNFGKEIAMTAGLDYAGGDAVIVIDADLQDPPELIPEMVDQWQNGYDVVFAKRQSRMGESLLKKTTANAFYLVMKKISRVPIPENTGDYRLLSRRAVTSLNNFKESQRFMKGIFAWIGYPQKEILFDRDPRYAGKTTWNYWRLWNFAIEGITSFTEAPLKIATYLGVIVALFSFIYGVLVIIRTLVWGDPVAGYPSLMTVILFLGGVQLLSIGIIGEYLGRVYSETKRRPLYILDKYVPSVLSSEFRDKKNAPAEEVYCKNCNE